MNLPTGRSRPRTEHETNRSTDEPAPGLRSLLGALVVSLAIIATVALALYQFVPPPVVPADAPATEFSAGRAMDHMAVKACSASCEGSGRARYPGGGRRRPGMLNRDQANDTVCSWRGGLGGTDLG